MTARIVIEMGAAVPVYEQIRSQLAGAIASGDVTIGARLPSVRILAADLGIAVNTVVRAYAELESAGLVTNRRGSGTVVVGRSSAAPPDAVSAAQQLSAAAAAAGMTTEQAIDLVRSAMVALGGQAAGGESM